MSILLKHAKRVWCSSPSRQREGLTVRLHITPKCKYLWLELSEVFPKILPAAKNEKPRASVIDCQSNRARNG